ncbi:MAG: dTDP-glucose 4,6-dehydratase [Verrucomicrobiae bacterium]|nr:dTDP-glucose 4,6-dehydratase [Verrucomicrobiae bacterium]MDW8344690.1 dTDP-glucose 4,6-dehydratase [Verrucomicrobiae bacterium]
MRVLVTGGAGFIGSNFVRFALERHPDWRITVLDKLTYAGNLANLDDIRDRIGFVRGDIANRSDVEPLVSDCDLLINFAAETHVDRSILWADDFVRTDILGTYVLLEAARQHRLHRFIQISTDEVYGSAVTGSFTEESPLNPRNPYSASKAGADRLAFAYFVTHNVPVIITRCSNNYGPYQHPEKFIPLCITNALEDQPLPIYGDGRQVRDWIHVLDHCDALDFLIAHGQPGETYNIAGGQEHENIHIARTILETLGKPPSLIRHVADRPGHDRRYSLNTDKLARLGWHPQRQLQDGLRETIEWYRRHRSWWQPIKSGPFRDYYKKQYGSRLSASLP